MKWYVYGALLLIAYGAVFEFAQELPRFSERLGVAGLAGILLMFGFMCIARALRERNRKQPP